MSEATEVELIPLLRQYADVADAGGKAHWATAMRRAAGRILALERYVIEECLCPCCEQTDVCLGGCTFADDCPDEAEAMEYARSVMMGEA
jgi:hypothetical protein